MYIYNVTIKVDHSILSDWIKWMKEEHLSEVTGTGLFTKYIFSELQDLDETEGKTFVVQYFTDSLDKYNEYINTYAPVLREKGFAKFGDRFIAFRTLMKEL